MVRHTFLGASGEKYEYSLLEFEPRTEVPREPGIFIMTTGTADDPEFFMAAHDVADLRHALRG